MKEFRLSRTGMVGLDDFVEMNLRKTGEAIPYTLDQNEEWLLEARVWVKFWANPAQIHDAQKIALRALYAGIYQEILRELPRLRLAISDGTRPLAFSICDKMESLMTNPQPLVRP